MTIARPAITRAVHVALATAFVVLPLAARAEHANGGGPTLSAAPLAGPIRVDGILEEPAWEAAAVADTLLTIEPREGAPPNGSTRVRVLADVHTLVIGIECDDPEPSAIVAFTTARDAILDNEDHIRLIFDTYLDGRSGYVFAVNPVGARYDALINPGGETENANWDGIWEAATARTGRGWSAEFRLPVQTLGFAQGSTMWHFNVQRRVQRLQETSRWAGARRDYRIQQTSHAGMLKDLPAFDLGLGLSVRPSLVAGGGVPEMDAARRGEAHASLDVTQRVGSSLLASFTTNTDFAETEVDTRKTNLTRFALLFPEKRTFFLEGADTFEFGMGAQDDVIPYFSRRIGLVSGGTVPIGAGAKLNGRLGRTSVGALAVRTRETDGRAPGASLVVARVKQDIGQESSIGFLGTTGDPNGLERSWTAGVDATYQTSRFRGNSNFGMGAWVLATDRRGLAGEKTAIGAKIDYPNDLWWVNFAYKRIGDGFLPSLGFVPRTGVHIYDGNVEFRPRPQNGWLRMMRYETRPWAVTDLDGRWESYRLFCTPYNWRFESGDRLELNYQPMGERLDAPFEIARGVVIPAGRYSWARKRIEGMLAQKRRVSGLFDWWWGRFYNGRLKQFTATVAVNPAPVVTFEVTIDRIVGSLPAGDFVQQVAGTRATFNFFPDLQLAAYVQYDNQSRTVGMNNRLRWTFSPVGDLFVIYNHNVRDIIDRWSLDNNQLLVKLQYTIRR